MQRDPLSIAIYIGVLLMAIAALVFFISVVVGVVHHTKSGGRRPIKRIRKKRT